MSTLRTDNIQTTDSVSNVTVGYLAGLSSTTDTSKGVSGIGGAMRVVDSVATLKTISKLTNSRVFLTSHTSLAQGGGGHYWYDTTDTTSADNGGSIIVANDGARWKLIFGFILTSAQFGSIADGSDQTAKVQLALSALGANGGVVQVPKGTKFNLKTLVFPVKSNLEYFVDSDTSTAGPGSELGSNELITFAANSSGAIVNEWRHTAAFHPGLILDARSDVTGQDAWLGGGQSRTDPVRVSYNIHQEQTDRYRLVMEKFNDYNQFSGFTQHAWRAVVTLNGIGTAQWVSVPTADITITGTTSGAKGYVISVSAGATTVLWGSGKFIAGETVSDNNETTVATITSVGFALTPMQPVGQDIKRGNWSVGLPVGSVRDQFAVGGKITAAKTRAFSQYVDETIDNPALCLIDSYEGTTNGFEITYNTTPSAANRRLTLRKYDTVTDIGLIGATRAATGFTNSVLAATSSYNVTSIVRNGTGDYTINFTNPFVTADYMVSYGTSDPSDFAYTFIKTTTSLRVKVVQTGTTTPRDLTNVLDVLCSCGDI